MHSKPKIEKKFTGIDQSSERASGRVPFSTSYLELALAHACNSRVKKRNIKPLVFNFNAPVLKVYAMYFTCM